MAVYDLQEQEQIEDLKAWWAQYGKYVSAGVTTLAVIVIGVQGWRWYQGSQAQKASVLYQAVSQAAHGNDPAKAKDPASQLETQYTGTAYAPRGALLYAKLLFEAGDKAGAKTQLQWVIDHASEEELRTIARYRIAQIQLDDRQYDEALKMLDAKTDDAFAPIYADLRGDILAAAGKNADARGAYQTALAKLDTKSTYRGFVQAKLDALGGPTTPSSEAAAASLTPGPAAAAAPGTPAAPPAGK
jgi:predicted negative regulator of RcsB-dependent stress response